jgi:ABC-2 type transport system ATP-binding protein
MEEAERCNRLAFLNHGKLVAQGTPVEIRQSLSDRRVYSIEIAHNPELTSALMKADGVQLVNQFGSEMRVITAASTHVDQLQKIIRKYFKESFRLMPVAPSIEDAFMSLTADGEKK